MKDYYQILEVTTDAGEDEIRRSYRRLAMQYHPDRNPDDPEAEANFKEVAEAYGVLTDPLKRRQYDAARAGGFARGNGGTTGFNYSQEDILRDLFRDPRFQQMFQGLLREFQRSGFRSSSQFVRHSFFGGKGLFIGGLFMFGSIAGPALLKSAAAGRSNPKSLLGKVGSAVGTLLGRAGGGDDKQTPAPAESEAHASRSSELDITYLTSLSDEELLQGKTIQVVTEGPDGQEMLKVKIPPNSRSGGRLRLRGRGRVGAEGRGDLYLQLDTK
jgi:curved DNA-binding protein CbpA